MKTLPCSKNFQTNLVIPSIPSILLFWFFGRTLGLISLIAYLSYWIQADALIGTNGINPWIEDLEKIEALTERNSELSKFSLRPTLLWFSVFSNHHLLFGLGTIAAISLTLGFLPLYQHYSVIYSIYRSWS